MILCFFLRSSYIIVICHLAFSSQWPGESWWQSWEDEAPRIPDHGECWNILYIFLKGVEGVRTRFSLRERRSMWQMIQKLFLVQTDHFLPEIVRWERKGRFSRDSQNIPVKTKTPEFWASAWERNPVCRDSTGRWSWSLLKKNNKTTNQNKKANKPKNNRERNQAAPTKGLM